MALQRPSRLTFNPITELEAPARPSVRRPALMPIAAPAGAGPLLRQPEWMMPRLFAGPGSYPGRVKGCSIQRATRQNGSD